MEKLVYVAILAIVVYSAAAALCIGAIAALFGVPFAPAAGVVFLCGLCGGAGALTMCG